MAWEQFTDPSTQQKQWVDTAKAGLWFQRAADLTTNDALARLDAASWAEQADAVKSTWQALAYGFQALDLPPVAQPYVVMNSLAWLGPVTGNDPGSARAQTVNHLMLRSPLQNTSNFGQRIFNWWRSLGTNPLTAYSVAGVFVRANLTSSSTVATQCISLAGVHDPACDFGGIGGGCSSGPGVHGCVAAPGYNWNTLAWNAPPQLPGAAAGNTPLIDAMSPPLRWSMEQAAELAGKLAGQGPLETVAQALRWAAVSNIASAANAGLLPADLATANQALISQYNTVVSSGRGEIAAAGAVLGTFVGIATANPAIGGLVTAALSALAAVAPIAVGCQEDYFGRCKPVLERTALTGTPNSKPTQVVPMPEAVSSTSTSLSTTPSPSASLQTSAPTTTTPTTTTAERVGLALGGLTVVGLLTLASKGKI